MTLEELAGKLTLIKVNLDELIDNLENGITGEIKFAPPPPPMKIVRKRRTREEIARAYGSRTIKMDLEKEYQAGRTGVGQVGVTEHLNLPDVDKGKAGEFFKKKKGGE